LARRRSVLPFAADHNARMVWPGNLGVIPTVHIRHGFTAFDLIRRKLPGTHLVAHRDIEELLFREVEIIEEEVETRRPLAVILLHELFALFACDAAIADIDIDKMICPTHSTFDKFQIVAHTLEEAFDLFIIVFGRNAFDFLALPAKFALNDLDVFLSIPLDVTAEAD